jgi:EpsI family protein
MKKALRPLAVAALMALAAVYMATHSDKPTPLAKPLAEFPVQVGDWKMIQDSRFDPETLRILKPTDYMAKRYRRDDGAVADLYVGYHDGASKAGPLHSPRNCLPGSGWYEVSSEPSTVQLPSRTLDTITAVYQNAGGTELFVYWFEVGGKAITNEYALKIQEVLHSIRSGRRAASFIRISVPMPGDKAEASVLALDFLKTVQPVLEKFLQP